MTHVVRIRKPRGKGLRSKAAKLRKQKLKQGVVVAEVAQRPGVGRDPDAEPRRS